MPSIGVRTQTTAKHLRVSACYDHFLPVAIGFPLNKVNLAFYYAQRLAAQSKPQDAIKYFAWWPRPTATITLPSFMFWRQCRTCSTPSSHPMPEHGHQGPDGPMRAGPAKLCRVVGSDRQAAAIATLVEAETAGADLKKPEQTLQLLSGFDEAGEGDAGRKVARQPGPARPAQREHGARETQRSQRQPRAVAEQERRRQAPTSFAACSTSSTRT